jgi:hypothetical protein
MRDEGNDERIKIMPIITTAGSHRKIAFLRDISAILPFAAESICGLE